jgi:hypothetical protein
MWAAWQLSGLQVVLNPCSHVIILSWSDACSSRTCHKIVSIHVACTTLIAFMLAACLLFLYM